MSLYGVIGYHVTLSEGHMIANHPIYGSDWLSCDPFRGSHDSQSPPYKDIVYTRPLRHLSSHLGPIIPSVVCPLLPWVLLSFVFYNYHYVSESFTQWQIQICWIGSPPVIVTDFTFLTLFSRFLIWIFTHLRFCLATVTRDFKWGKSTHIFT